MLRRTIAEGEFYMMMGIPAVLLPREGETLVDYWVSFSPAAPLFGIDWRFEDMMWGAVSPQVFAPTRESATVLTEGHIEDAEFEDVTEAVGAADEAAAAPAPAADDDLTRMRGVGPKLAAELHEMGLTSFAQIAELTEENLQQISNRLTAFKDRPMRDDWIGQARSLMGGHA